jgi:tryptophan synthase beta subunit
LQYGLKGYEGMKEIQNAEYLQNAHKTLADIYVAQKDFEKGFFHPLNYMLIQKIILKKSMKKRVFCLMIVCLSSIEINS